MKTSTDVKPETEKKTKNPKRHLKRLAVVLAVLIFLAGTGTLATVITLNQTMNLINTVPQAAYTNQLNPILDEDGYYTFVTDRDFKILQLTDIHFGGGWISSKKDKMTANCVAALVSAEQPDLVIATGDIAYPVPFQAGTFNNKNGAKLFANLMESLGVYWTLAFGNHDTEAYSYFSRAQISEFYTQNYEYCLFQSGPEDINGYGNQFIKVKNTRGEITQILSVLDSGSYTDGDIFGIRWEYDNVHDDQIEWFQSQMNAFRAENETVGAEMPKSMLFLHIPFEEYKFAWDEYKANGHQDTENVKYYYGLAGETDETVYNSKYENNLFETLQACGTQAVFCGHDHYNGFSVDYKGIRLTYGASIDYLAYDLTDSISTKGSQRGCTIITVFPDGTAEIQQKNYYTAAYPTVTALEKEEVTMQWDS